MDVDVVPSSPTISSPSSSDLDTESTGSFFPDRSTTLGTLMGVSVPADVPVSSVRVPSGGSAAVAGAIKPAERRRRRIQRRGRSWWRLCRDEAGPTSLGEFLKVERRTAGADVADGSFFFGGGGGGGPGGAEHVAVGGGPLFENGRVLPPPLPAAAEAAERRRRERVPLLLAGICTGGEG